jgi:endonuclease YncB( thermonuclease family)
MTEYADGDSFHVRQGGRDYIFRLYFVDAPETDSRFPDRVKEQAKHFKISRKRVNAAGEQAARFTTGLLARPFTVVTKWEDARGTSNQERFYAIVLCGGQNLAEALVKAGWAQSYGMFADHPTEAQGKAFRKKLDELEVRAREDSAGTWGMTATSDSATRKSPALSKAKPTPAKSEDKIGDAVFEKLGEMIETPPL